MHSSRIYCTCYGYSHPYSQDVADLYKLWTGKPLADFITINEHLVVARTGRGETVGAAQITVIPDVVHNRMWGLVENIFVHPQYRQQGVGKQLMRFTEQQAFILGCSFIKLTSRKPEGQALYRSLGYQEGVSFYCDMVEPTVTTVQMERA